MYHTLSPEIPDNKLVRMVVKAHFNDVLTKDQQGRLAGAICKGLYRVNDDIGAIHIFAEQETLETEDVPVYLVPKEFAHIPPVYPWVQPYTYMYKASVNQMETQIIIVAAVNTLKGVKVMRVAWPK